MPGSLELDRWDIAKGAMKTIGVEPMHPLGGRQLQRFDLFPRAPTFRQFRFVEPVDRFRQGVVIRIGNCADRRPCADLVDAFGEPDAGTATRRLS